MMDTKTNTVRGCSGYDQYRKSDSALIAEKDAEIERLRNRVAQLEYDPCDGCEHGCCACMCFRKEENDKAIAGVGEET